MDRRRGGPDAVTGDATDQADVGQGDDDGARGRRAVVRAQMGWLPLRRVSRWRRGGAQLPQPEVAHPLLPRADRSDPFAASAPMRRRLRGGRRHTGRARLRSARPAHPPGGHPHRTVVDRDPGIAGRLRPAGARRHRPAPDGLRRTARRARVVDGRRHPAGAPLADHRPHRRSRRRAPSGGRRSSATGGCWRATVPG